METTGKLTGIARKAKTRAPMEMIDGADISTDLGISGDYRGKAQRRQVTVLSRKDWQEAARAAGAPDLPWTTRRANLLVDDFDLPHRIGARLSVGAVILEVVEETAPCQVMDAQLAGLRDALTPDWRGGVACKVISGGSIKVGDPVRLV